MIHHCLKMTFGLSLLATLCTVPFAAAAEGTPSDRVKLDRTVVSGNQELPKVLYILPWESKESRPMLDYGLEPYTGDIMQRVDPASHRRQLDQLDALRGATPTR